MGSNKTHKKAPSSIHLNFNKEFNQNSIELKFFLVALENERL